MNKMLIVVAVLTMTAVGYGENATAEKPAAKSKKVKVTKQVKKSKRRSAAAAPVAPATTPVDTTTTVTTTETITTTPVTAAPVAPSTVETVAVPSQSKVLGVLETRPTVTHVNGEWHSENEAALGYQFNKNVSVSAHQLFNTNIYNPNVNGDSSTRGMNLQAQDGFARVKLNNIAGDTAGVALSYEGRVYAPTYAPKRDAGMITTWRNYFKLRHDFGKTFNLTLMETPILHAYDRAGSGSKANPIFENRVYLIAGVNITDSLSFEFPVILNSVRNRDYSAGTRLNNDWAQVLWIYPEISYQLTPNLALGVAYYNDNFLVNSTFDSFKLKEGLEAGYTQAVLRASL